MEPTIKIANGPPGEVAFPAITGGPSWVRSGPPECLDFVAQSHWRTTIGRLFGVLSERDCDAVSIYCQAWSDWLRYRAIIKKEGEFQATKQGILVHPACKRREAAEAVMRHFQKQFGMTPGSRSAKGEKDATAPQGMTNFARKRK